MHRNRSVDVHAFSMVPRASIPRSSFRVQTTHKTTFDAGYLIPVYVDEVLPGDSFNLRMTCFARLSTPLYPIMDNLHLDSFFFFVPNRLVWRNWKRMMGEQDRPTDSVSFVVPQVPVFSGGAPVGSLFDYFGVPTVGQANAVFNVNALPLRAYNLIWDQWFRDENLQDSVILGTPDFDGDGPDDPNDYALLRRGKRHDYFTSCLPWPQKGQSVALPLGTSAPVYGSGTNPIALAPTGQPLQVVNIHNTSSSPFNIQASGTSATANLMFAPNWEQGLYADLSEATAATINQLRQSFQIQKLLERDARGGTRYTEIIRSHFGVVSPDARLQRPEYLGGGTTPVNINPISQTSATGVQGGTTPLGNLGGIGTVASSGHGFRQSFTEHGYVIGMVVVRADLTYQQGLRKLWSRKTRYDFYWPVFAMLGEQAVLNREIYTTGNTAQDDGVFGYQERWSEYRHHPSMITGLFRSTATGTIDGWHLAQRFTTLPTLNSGFIQDVPPVERVLAVGAAAGGQQFIFDSFFDVVKARPMPMYSVPGLIDHF